jgi:hypothetical protein
MWKDNLGSNFSKSIYFGVTNIFKNDDLQHKFFLENFGLLVIKNHLHLQIVKGAWLKCLIMHSCLRMVFPSRNIFSQKKTIFFSLLGEKNQTIF